MFKSVIDASNAHDQELMWKAIGEVFEPDVRMGTPLPIKETGADAVKAVYSALHRAFPDLHIAVQDVIAEGDKIVSRQAVTGTHTGEAYMGVPATGASVAYNEIFVLRFEAGRVAETWGVVDVHTLLWQLGAVRL
ncbi:ester cyclase [Actinomadura sp. NAK00032]|uniref:ester cyclase n=1 Tax=Actinomadura sp. NAK00032 TaxID=2742128 RepID=UPI001C3763DA|nr:ester cyclase [Actinomadura sp. NAK00032]